MRRANLPQPFTHFIPFPHHQNSATTITNNAAACEALDHDFALLQAEEQQLEARLQELAVQ